MAKKEKGWNQEREEQGQEEITQETRGDRLINSISFKLCYDYVNC